MNHPKREWKEFESILQTFQKSKMENTVAQLFDPEGGYELDVEIGKRIVGEKVGFKAFIYGSPEHMVHRNS